MATIKVDDEIQSVLPPLTANEEARLEAKLKTEGCRERLTLGIYPELSSPILIDGHNRKRICESIRIPYEVGETIEFVSRHDLIRWVIGNQLARRNLTEKQRAYFRGKDYLIAKQPHGGDRKSSEAESSAQNEHLIETKTAEALAEMHGVGQATIRRDAQFAAAVDKIGEEKPELKEAILNGKSDLTKGKVIAMAGVRRTKRSRTSKQRTEYLTYEGKFDHIVRHFSNLSSAITRAMHTQGGEKLLKYLTFFKLVVYGQTVIVDGEKKVNAPKFRGFAGLKRVIRFAALPGSEKTQAEVEREYRCKDKKDED